MVTSWQETIKANANILPITSLSHVTHNEQADKIKGNSDKMVFTPKAKVGKALGRYDGSPVDETFKVTGQGTHVKIPPGSPVFPGQISWWGISSTNWRETELGRNTRAKVVDSKTIIPGLVEANYLKDMPDSRYGNCEFIVSHTNLMASYKQSRQTNCTTDKNVCFKKAGTLHYKYEICYVIMVAMEGDIVDRIFDDVAGSGQFLHFKINHPFTSYTDKFTKSCVSYSWETLAFGLYFPDNPESVLQCRKDYCIEKKIDHSFCTATKPSVFNQYNWVCPNVEPSTLNRLTTILLPKR